MKPILQKFEQQKSMVICIALFCIGLFVFLKVLSNGFVWDDTLQITQNSALQGNILSLFTESTYSSYGAVSNSDNPFAGGYYKPLMMVVFSSIYAVAGPNPFSFHFFDVVLHSINAMLFFFLIRRLLRDNKIAFPQTTACILSLIFLIHPATIESVAFISATQELLYKFFLFLALFFCLQYFSEEKKHTQSLIWLQVCFLLGLFSKESAIILPILVTAYAILFFGKKHLKMLLTFLPTFFFYLFMRFGVAHIGIGEGNAFVFMGHATLIERLLTLPSELWYYLRVLFFLQGPFIEHDYIISSFSDPQFYMPLVFDGIFLMLIIMSIIKMKSRLYTFFCIWFFAALLLVLNIIPLDDTTAVRWLYFPLTGMLAMIGLLLNRLLVRYSFLQPFTVFIVTLSCISMLFVTVINLPYWQNNVTLFSHYYDFVKGSSLFESDYATALAEQNELTKAKMHALDAVSLNPENYATYNTLGYVYQQEGNIPKAKEAFRMATRGGYPLAYYNLANIIFHTEKPENALTLLEQGLSLFPDNPDLNSLAASIYNKIGDSTKAQFYEQKTLAIPQE